MSVKKSVNKMWGGVFDDSPDDLMTEINASISFDKVLYKYDVMGSVVHSQMLAKQGIITAENQKLIEDGLNQIVGEIESGEFVFSQELEDIHMNIESRLIEIIGDAGKMLHTARSRNDQVVTDFKLYVKDACVAMQAKIVGTMGVLVERAREHCGSVMPSFTHLQVAQPVSVGHYLLAYVEMLWRDYTRFSNVIDNMDSCPLGSAAVAGTSYDIDRVFVAENLGFREPSRNSIDSVSDRDFALDFMYTCSVLSIHLSRLMEEVVIFCTSEFEYLKMPDRFSTGSSIMPQKRNPDAAELVRAKTGVVIGNLMSLLVIIKGLTLAYSKDLQEDKVPVFNVNRNMRVSLDATSGMLKSMQFNVEKLRDSAMSSYSTATDLADYLVQKLGIPFRNAHEITGKIVRRGIELKQRLDELSLEEYQKECAEITKDVFEFVTVESSVSRRTSFGGTAFDNVKGQIEFWEERLKSL